MDAKEASERRIGTTLKDKWVLEQLLGVGGMASVYLARHKIGRREAIKILHSDIASSEQIRARFEQEARAVNALRHPGVVEVRDIDVTEDGAPFLVMELLEGEPLSSRSRREPRLTTDDVLRIGIETLDALAAVHAHGIIHRDIKPDNLFLTSDGKIKVLDFGIARVRSGGRALATQAGVTLGTMAYMPPEQARGLEIDARADLYAVAATMFRLLSGKIIHDATTDAELVMKAMTEPARSLASVVPSAPAGVVAVVDRGLAFDRAHRYPDASTMRADVEAAARGEPLPYDSKAPPLPSSAASSELFDRRESFAGTPEPKRDAPTVAPPPKLPPPSTPNVVITPSLAGSILRETAPGVAPEVAPTRATSPALPSAAMPSAPRLAAATVVSRGSSPEPNAAAPMVSSATASDASADSRRTLVYLIAAGAALLFVLMMGTLFAVLVTRTYFASSPAEPASASASTPEATARPVSSPAPPPKRGKKDKRKDD